MAAAIWSCPTATMRDFPALSFLHFFRNHGLLDLVDRPQWRTVVGRSRRYVARLIADLSGAAHAARAAVHSLVIARVPQVNRAGWAAKRRALLSNSVPAVDTPSKSRKASTALSGKKKKR